MAFVALSPRSACAATNNWANGLQDYEVGTVMDTPGLICVARHAQSISGSERPLHRVGRDDQGPALPTLWKKTYLYAAWGAHRFRMPYPMSKAAKRELADSVASTNCEEVTLRPVSKD